MIQTLYLFVIYRNRKTNVGLSCTCIELPHAALAKVNRDLCNNVVLQRSALSDRSFYRLASNGGTRIVPNGRVTGCLCFSSIVINTCGADAPSRWNFFRRLSDRLLHKYSIANISGLRRDAATHREVDIRVTTTFIKTLGPLLKLREIKFSHAIKFYILH